MTPASFRVCSFVPLEGVSAGGTALRETRPSRAEWPVRGTCSHFDETGQVNSKLEDCGDDIQEMCTPPEMECGCIRLAASGHSIQATPDETLEARVRVLHVIHTVANATPLTTLALPPCAYCADKSSPVPSQPTHTSHRT